MSVFLIYSRVLGWCAHAYGSASKSANGTSNNPEDDNGHFARGGRSMSAPTRRSFGRCFVHGRVPIYIYLGVRWATLAERVCAEESMLG